MKNFDLEAAKRGAAVMTMHGHRAKILCFDKKGKLPVVATIDFEDHEVVYDYFEDGNHIVDANEMVGPAIKQNLNTDREYWRRVYAGQAMQGIFAGRNWRSGEMIPDCIGFARNAVELADALIEELEKTETK